MAFLTLRAWWYAKGFGKSERMPRDVREYIIVRYMIPAFAALKTDEEKEKFATEVFSSVLQMGPNEISKEILDYIIKTSFEFIRPSNPLPTPSPVPSRSQSDK
jgi:hypothetical protein